MRACCCVIFLCARVCVDTHTHAHAQTYRDSGSDARRSYLILSLLTRVRACRCKDPYVHRPFRVSYRACCCCCSGGASSCKKDLRRRIRSSEDEQQGRNKISGGGGEQHDAATSNEIVAIRGRGGDDEEDQEEEEDRSNWLAVLCVLSPTALSVYIASSTEMLPLFGVAITLVTGGLLAVARYACKKHALCCRENLATLRMHNPPTLSSPLQQVPPHAAGGVATTNSTSTTGI